jgi:hypothetical protein
MQPVPGRVWRRWLAHLAAMWIIVFPIVVIALDHHGAERIPGHEHLTPFGETPPAHLHGFEVAHVHGPAVTTAPATTPALATAQPIVLTILSFLQDAALRPNGAPSPMVGVLQTGVPSAAALTAQTAPTPPTPPPDARRGHRRQATDA